uniref:uncharacterized protein LOC120342099 n=1 Tax=Styela clava TaxID=7725 RepID=UPI00193A318D|nr:uncharacterized protein LOC120342099 [Styela clava]
MEHKECSGDGACDKKKNNSKNDTKQMDVPETKISTVWNQKDERKKNKKLNNSWEKDSSNTLQPDGQKLLNGNIHNDFGDMSRATARNSSFKDFPKRILINKIINSGYFYTGEGDTTICYKCRAVVYDWNDKDNPATFHEPDCEFHSHRMETSAEKQIYDDKDSISSMEGTSTLSILDAPITEPSIVAPLPPVVIKPTVAATNNMFTGREFPHSISPPHILRQTSLPDHQQYSSLPVFNTTFENQDNTKSIETRVTSMPIPQKKFVKKTHKTYLALSGIIEDEHETLLRNLNLRSEEERRKSFTVKGCWKQNTNNVVRPYALAKDGFFYLGNLDRTQCFSCNKILKTWHRGDCVNQVHRTSVPFCLMAKGEDETNIPIQQFLSMEESLSSNSSLDPLSGGFTRMRNEESGMETSLEISKSTLPSRPEEFFNYPFQLHGHTPMQSKETPISQSPLDLTVNRNFPQAIDPVLYNPVSSQENNISMEIENNEDIPYPIQQITGDEELSPQESPPIALQTTSNLPEVSQSWHLGQTTLYNTTSSLPSGNEAGEGPHTSGSETHPLETHTNLLPGSSTTEQNWSEVFPCSDPTNPEMRSAVARQDTFDFRWTQRGIDNVDELARAGFYYDGDDTNVRCWYCGGGVRHWNNTDDPWVEHARLYPNCEFLLQQKGFDFVSEVANRPRANAPRANTPEIPTIQTARYAQSSSSESPQDSPFSSFERPLPGSPYAPVFLGNRFGQNAPRVVDPREEEAKHKRMLEQALNSQAMLTALDMGFDLRTIKRTIKQKIQNTDSSFDSTQQLLDALLTAPAGGSSSSESEDEEQAPVATSTNSETTPTTPTPITTASSSIPSTSGAQGGDLQFQDSSKEGDPRNLDEKLREYEQEKRCKVCLDRTAEVVFVPCGHLCTCIPCANALRNCPLCRKRIVKSMKIYTS